MHEQKTTELVYALRTGNICTNVHLRVAQNKVFGEKLTSPLELLMLLWQ